MWAEIYNRVGNNHKDYEVLRMIMWFLAIVLGIHFVYRTIIVPTIQGTTYIDFQAYYAASHALLKGENIYCKDLPMYLNMFQRKITFLYPPLAALFFVPFSILTYKASALLWLGFNLFLVWVIINFLTIQKPLWNRHISMLLLLICVFLFWPLEEHLGGGQSCLLVLALLLWCCQLIKQDKVMLAGALIAATAHFRLMPGIFFLYFLAKRQWRLAIWTAAWGTLLAIIGLAVIGYELHHYYFKNTIPYLLEYKKWYSNQAFMGFMFLLRETGLPLSKEASLIIVRSINSIILFGALVYFSLRKIDFKKVVLEEFAFLLLVTLFVAGYTITYYFVFCLLPFWIFRPDERSDTQNFIEFACFALAFTLIAFPLGYANPILRRGFFHLWIPTKFYGLVILMFLSLKKIVASDAEKSLN